MSPMPRAAFSTRRSSTRTHFHEDGRPHERNTTVKTQWIAIGSLLVASVAGGTISQAADAGASSTPVCATPAPGTAHCLADVVTGLPIARSTGTIIGYSASQLESAYKLPITRGAGQTIALVDAYDDPT